MRGSGAVTRRIYVASSWRNAHQPLIVQMLRQAGHAVYDFRNPQSGGYPSTDSSAYGFHWSEIDPNWQAWRPESYKQALQHPVARQGFDSDYEAMQWADTGVLVLPCGRSAHLEAGYFNGAGKDLFILLMGPQEPELMYLMATDVCLGLGALCNALDVTVLQP